MILKEAKMVSEWTGLEKEVTRFERSWRLDTALYMNLPFLLTLYVPESFHNWLETIILSIVIMLLFF